MMRNLFLSVLLMFTVLSLSAELNQLRIVGQAEKTSDIVPARYETVNRERAACIIFVTDLAVDLDFRPRIDLVGLANPASGQFHVYVDPAERFIDVHALGYEPLTVVLREFGISSLRSNDVYRLRLTGERPGHIADRDLHTVQFTITPEDVYISLNNAAPVLNRGSRATFRVSAGNNRFTFIKQGYGDKTIELSVSENVTQAISLDAGTTATTLKLPGFVIINSNPQGAQLFINEQLVGTTPYTGQLLSGSYNYSLTMPLYQTNSGTFNLAEGETLNLPTVSLTPRFGNLQITSNPAGADVILNNQNRGKTPINRFRIDSGEYELELRLGMYHIHRETILISDGDDRNLNIRLQPAYGELRVTSAPESNADVFVDDVKVGSTPYTNNRQPSGRYLVKVEKELWTSSPEYVTVEDAKQSVLNLTLNQNFGTITVSSRDSEIYLDGTRVGRDRYEARLSPGRYSLTAKKERHIDAERDVFLQMGQNERIELNPTPRQGALSVATRPFESHGAEIWIDKAKRNETTPAVIPLLIGNYEVTVKHRDFLEATRSVRISEGLTQNLEFDLQTYRGSMQAKANFWRANKWVAISGTVIAIAGAAYFDYLGQGYVDDFKNAEAPQNELKAWQDSESAFDKRDLCLYIAVAPAVYTLFSWFREGSYRRRM